MRNKLIFTGFMFLAIMVIPNVAFAKEDIYYTNLNGATLTKEQYNNLLKVFDEDTIATMEKSGIDIYKNDTNLTKVENVKYIKTDYFYDAYGNVILSRENEVNEDEADLFVKNHNNGVQTAASSHQTSMKKLVITGVAGTLDVKTFTITNTWLSMPQVRSFDVIAFGNGENTTVLTFGNISGYQKADGEIINYSSNGTNIKKNLNGGVGISMNIVDTVSTSLINSLTVSFYTNTDPFLGYGTYQHATSDVSLSQSQNYTFSTNGYGRVLNFASSVRGYYDNMQGVELELAFGDF
ncbi:MAG: hypothetical protein J6C28_00810 [Bacilli bacterium]|nr:hypothetical protein [Bacilli bacterium]